jgi:uracil-DNA glycosylase
MNSAADLLARLLRQRAEFGADEIVVSAEAIRWLRPPDSAPKRVEAAAATPQAISPRRSFMPAPSPTAWPEPAGDARLPGALGALEIDASRCTACRLAGTRTAVVFGEGSPAAEVVVVGEAPGAEEDRTGRPFVGRAGKLLDTLLAAIDLERSGVFICNVLKCRPPGNRNPQPEEVAACSPYLFRQIELISPKAILACGTFSAQTLLETTEPIGRLRGGRHEVRGIPVVATYHPAALLRNPAWLRLAWEDLQLLRRLLAP